MTISFTDLTSKKTQRPPAARAEGLPRYHLGSGSHAVELSRNCQHSRLISAGSGPLLHFRDCATA